MRATPRHHRTAAIGLAAALGTGIGLAPGCSAPGAGEPDDRITVWSLENLAPRMEATKKIVAAFERESGVRIDLVGVEEGQLPQLVMSAAAAGTLPDVIGGVTLASVWQMYTNDLLNTAAADRVITGLGRETFNTNALELTSDGATSLAVPSDSWMQVLVYRKDLFDAAGLTAPDTYDTMLKAAATLDRGSMNGISLATDPSDVFTQQSFESLALANDCRLVTGGEVTLDSRQCRTTFDAYGKLARDHGPPGTQTLDSTRSTYFAGRSSMILWSTFLLDELAGLRDDALPSCAQCQSDPEYLTRTGGIVIAMKGPDAKTPAQFGDTTSWAVTTAAETGASEKFVRHMMSGGYQDWIGMAPEGKIPVRGGTPEDPGKYSRAWRTGDIGVDTKRPMDEVYPPELLDALLAGVSDMRRWGIEEGQGALVGAALGELPVPKAVGSLVGGRTTPREAAKEADEEVRALWTSLG